MKSHIQEKRVFEYAREHHGITRYDAFRYLSVANLTAVISRMRKSGKYIIVTEIKHGENSYGEYKYAKYFISEVSKNDTVTCD